MRNIFFAMIVLYSVGSWAYNLVQRNNQTQAATLAMPVAQAMLRYHDAALLLKEASPALTGTITPSISGFANNGFYQSCANGSFVATVLINSRQAQQGQVVTALQTLDQQAPGIGLSSSNQVNVAGTMTALPCPVADGLATVLTQVH